MSHIILLAGLTFASATAGTDTLSFILDELRDDVEHNSGSGVAPFKAHLKLGTAAVQRLLSDAASAGLVVQSPKFCSLQLRRCGFSALSAAARAAAIDNLFAARRRSSPVSQPKPRVALEQPYDPAVEQRAIRMQPRDRVPSRNLASRMTAQTAPLWAAETYLKHMRIAGEGVGWGHPIGDVPFRKLQLLRVNGTDACACLPNLFSPEKRELKDGCRVFWEVPQDPSPKCFVRDDCMLATFGDQYNDMFEANAGVGSRGDRGRSRGPLMVYNALRPDAKLWDLPLSIPNRKLGKLVRRLKTRAPLAWRHCATPFWRWKEPPTHAALIAARMRGDLGDAQRSDDGVKAMRRIHSGAPVRFMPRFAAVTAASLGAPPSPSTRRHYVFQTDCLVDGLSTTLLTVAMTPWVVATKMNARVVWNPQHFASENTPQLRFGDALARPDVLERGPADTFHPFGFRAFEPSAAFDAEELFRRINAGTLLPLYVSEEIISEAAWGPQRWNFALLAKIKAELQRSTLSGGVERAVVLQRCSAEVPEASNMGEWLQSVYHASRELLRPVHPLWFAAHAAMGRASAWSKQYVVVVMSRAGDIADKRTRENWDSHGMPAVDASLVPHAANIRDDIITLQSIFGVKSSGGHFPTCANTETVVISMADSPKRFARLSKAWGTICPGRKLRFELSDINAGKTSSARQLFRDLDVTTTSDIFINSAAGSMMNMLVTALADPTTLKITTTYFMGACNIIAAPCTSSEELADAWTYARSGEFGKVCVPT